jgi:chitodextrinase
MFMAAGCAAGSQEATSAGDDAGDDSAQALPMDAASDAAVVPEAAADSAPAADSGPREAGVVGQDSSAPDSSDGAAPPMDGGDTTPPSAPAVLKQTGATATSITLGWTVSTDPDSPVAGYHVYRDGTEIGTSATNSFTDTGLVVKNSYTYTVSAYDPSNNTSALSTPLAASTTADTTPPSVPTGLTQTGSTLTTVSLGWTASTDDVGVTGYKIYRNGTQVGTSASTSFTDTGLTSNTNYSYTVSAHDAAGNDSAQSTPLGASTSPDTTPPSVPTGLSKTGATTTTISLRWTASTDPDSPVAGYKIYRNGTQVGTSASTSFTDTGLTVATSYSYKVSAHDPAGNNSAQSAALNASTAGCAINVTKNTYDTTYDGYVGYLNTGTGAETNPTVTFTIPSGATLDPTGCAWGNQSAPGCTSMTCSQNGTTITYAFTGALAAGETLTLYYSTDQASEPLATNILVTAPSCP